MYICIVDQAGHILLHQNLPVDSNSLLQIVIPYMPDIVIAVECIFTWYWIADFCEQYQIRFVLGHVLYMKAIHGSKTKNDRIDSHKIAVLLRGGMIPIAYVYPAKMRSTRDLLRRRMFFMRKRAELLAHIQNTNSQYNLPTFENSIARKRYRHGIKEHFPEKSVQKNIELDPMLLGHYDSLLNDIELFLTNLAKEQQPNNLFLLKTIPGIGKILSLVMLYSIIS